MNAPVTREECTKHRDEIAQRFARIDSRYDRIEVKLDMIPWQLVTVCLVIIGAIVGVTVFV